MAIDFYFICSTHEKRTEHSFKHGIIKTEAELKEVIDFINKHTPYCELQMLASEYVYDNEFKEIYTVACKKEKTEG